MYRLTSITLSTASSTMMATVATAAKMTLGNNKQSKKVTMIQINDFIF